MHTYKVVGTRKVAGVEPGGTVDLDPALVNIEALVRGGHIEAVVETKPATKKPEPRDKPTAGES